MDKVKLKTKCNLLCWNCQDQCRSVMTCLVHGTSVQERARQNKISPDSSWWTSFHFKLLEKIIDKSDSSIIDTIYQYTPPFSHSSKAPEYVITFRGTLIKSKTFLQDIKLDRHVLRNDLHKTSRASTALQAVQKLTPSATFSISNNLYKQVSYAELSEATGGFSSESLIGCGSFATVHKGRIDGCQKDVAIKVLKLQQKGADKSFETECEALKNIRHGNLTKILTTCSTVNTDGNEFKALVFDLMPNGSLEEALHPKNDCPSKLSFAQRLDIAIDVAFALEYLHHYSNTTIVHCDLKPSNILLDDEMNDRVTDFGLARFINGDKSMTDKDLALTIAIKGSIGYIAPRTMVM